MSDVINQKIDGAKEILSLMETYSTNRLDGNFQETIDKSLLENLGGNTIDLDQWYLYRMDELVFAKEEGLKREAMENVLATFRGLDEVNILYLILGDERKVSFYMGVSEKHFKDAHRRQGLAHVALGIDSYGNHVLEPSLRGNFVGSTIKKIDDKDKIHILQRIQGAKDVGFIDGVPGFMEMSMREKRDFQGVERLVDTMVGTNFGLLVIATPCNGDDVVDFEQSVNRVVDSIEPLGKTNFQRTISKQEQSTNNESKAYTRSLSAGKSVDQGSSTSRSESQSKDERNDRSNQINRSHSDTQNVQQGNTNSTNESYNNPKMYSRQSGTETSSTVSETVSSEESVSVQISTSTSDSYMNQWSETEGNTKAMSHSQSASTSRDYRKNHSKNLSNQKSYNESVGSSSSESDTWQTTSSMETEKKAVTNWLKYIDESLLPRIDRGKSKGSFIAVTYLFVDDKRTHLYRLANTVMALYGGDKGNVVPLHFTELSHECNRDNPEAQAARAMFENFQIPMYYTKDEPWKGLFSKPDKAHREQEYLGSWVTVDELGILMGMPQREVLGMSTVNEVEYGLNLPELEVDEASLIDLGCLVHHGQKREGYRISLEKKHLNKHTFICGVTGSGKTTTCQSMLLKANLPFLVIEPAKTEYRTLIHEEGGKDILYFTVGNQQVAPFFINPFEIFEGESIASRADMLKATITSAFDMEAAMPQIIEAATYAVYEKKGWNIRSNQWINPMTGQEDNPFRPDSYAFPMLSDFVDVIVDITKAQGFGDRLEAEYIGSLKARLQSLTVGAKGLMLNTPRSIDFKDLVTKKVVIELEEIKDGAEKSLIMGFIVTNLLEAVKAKYREYNARGEQFQHVTLIEEAYRLLSKYEPGDSPNKRLGVETFADMLAEVRKYGESLIIVDQIPNKMTPEVLKNTSTKIVHKIFAQDDKEAIGNTMALEREQKEFLSYLDVGRAIVITEGWKKPVQVQVKQLSQTTGVKEVSESHLRERALAYYATAQGRHVLPGLSSYRGNVTAQTVESYLQYVNRDVFLGVTNKGLYTQLKTTVENIHATRSIHDFVAYLFKENLTHVKTYLEQSKDEVYQVFQQGQLNIINGHDVGSKLFTFIQRWYETYEEVGYDTLFERLSSKNNKERKEFVEELQAIVTYMI